jgi:ABC-2 type transport system ATP-binding protein
VRGISIKLPSHTTTFIGRNGAGKTTTIRMLSTQLSPTRGTASINGYDIVRDANKLRSLIANIPQEASPVGWLTSQELLRIYLVARGLSFKSARDEASRALRALELWHSRNTPTDMLSGGMKRKLFVAMALAANADTVFLDEPTTGLDPLSRMQVWSAIRQLDCDIILTTHYMEEAHNLSDEVVLIDSGRILAHGTVPSLLRRFDGRVRVETTSKKHSVRMRYNISGTYISYVGKAEAEELLDEGGYTIKPVTLDDLFIVNGVSLES